jgi:beta-glucosidase
VATFLTEQAYRQGPLKGFEGALTNNGSLGTMTAYNRIGCIPTAADYQTMTLVLRKEWGFKGINMTDSSKDASSYMSTADCLYAGTNQFNNDKDRVSEASSLLTKSKDGFIWQKLRETAHYYLYAMSRSNLINGLASDTVVKDFVPWWKPATVALDISLGVIGVGLLGVFVFLSLRKKKGE